MTGTTCRPYAPGQALLLPPDLRDWLPEGHLAHHVGDLVDALDLGAFHAPCRGDGRRRSPYHPAMMVKVLVYGYATGVFSSRKLARKLEEDVAFRVLAAENTPDHRTVCEFRRRRLSDFRRLFVEVVRLARETGVAQFGTLSVDGTKVRANASRRKATSHGRMVQEERRLQEEIEALVARAQETDAAEDDRFGESVRGDGQPEGLRRRKDRLSAIQAAKGRLEARARAADDARGRKPGQRRNPKGGQAYSRACGEPKESAQDNFADPESRIMKTSQEGYRQCFDAQVAVEGGNRLVVAAEVTPSASDQGHLVKLPDEVKESQGVQPERVLADTGHCSESDLAELEARGVEGHAALGRTDRKSVAESPETYPAKVRMAARLATEASRKACARRKWLSEAPNGWIKEAMGFRRFSVRGLGKVRGEWDLVCLALNVRRLLGLQAA